MEPPPRRLPSLCFPGLGAAGPRRHNGIDGGSKPASRESGRLGSVFLQPKTTTIVYDTYGGGLTSKYRLLDEPNSYLGRTEITVPKKDSPLFLVLVSYSATEWDMNIQPGAQIAEILVLGYHHQIVSHVPPKTEVGFSIYVGAAGNGCPKGIYWTDHDLPSKLRPMLSGRFSRGIDEYYRSSSEECVKAGCLGFSKEVKQQGGSFWSRLFGSKAQAAPETADSVRASASLLICGDNCGKRKID
jgi:hypothetical protein